MGAESRDMLLVALQVQLEELYSKNQTIERIRAEFEKHEDVRDYLISHEIPMEFGIAILVQMALHKRANIETLVGVMFHHLKDAQKTVDMLVKCAEAELMIYDPTLKLFMVRFEVSQQVQEELDKFQYPLPMVVEPKSITNNFTSGYYLNESSVLLRNNHHSDDVCLDHLNRANRVKLTTDMDTMKMVKNKWKSLDKKKEDEDEEDFIKRKKQFQKYDKVSKDVMTLLSRHGDEFYLTHAYDKRGRVYCRGYHVNYQGNAWNKATIQFADKELVE